VLRTDSKFTIILVKKAIRQLQMGATL